MRQGIGRGSAESRGGAPGRAPLRHYNRPPMERWRFGDFVLDLEARELTRAGTPVSLSPKAFQLLGLLVQSHDKALSKTELQDRLWPGTFVVEKNLTNLVSEIREALGDDPAHPRFIRTVHRFGYAFREVPSRRAATTTSPPSQPSRSAHGLHRARSGNRGAPELVASTRLLTLTGAGGCGKTRLALDLGVKVLDRFPDGVWVVDLAALSDPGLVTQSGGIGVRHSRGTEPADSRCALRLRPQPADPPHPRQLRAPDYRLRSARGNAAPCGRARCASWPRAGRDWASRAKRSGACLLSRSRSRSSRRRWRHSANTTRSGCSSSAPLPSTRRSRSQRPTPPRLAQVCDRLDGIPLAIELAAARVKVLSIEQINARLNDRFRLLTGGSRTAVARQRTLEATVDWSYELLSGAERQLLRRLSVFAGGWTIEAAEDVTSGDGRARRGAGSLSRLVDKSLVNVEGDGDEGPRYRFLETVRQYAARAPLQSAEAERLRDRHLAFFASWLDAPSPSCRERSKSRG